MIEWCGNNDYKTTNKQQTCAATSSVVSNEREWCLLRERKERVVQEIININNKKAIENSIGSSKFWFISNKKADIEAKQVKGTSSLT
jgi:hypothetical protein